MFDKFNVSDVTNGYSIILPSSKIIEMKGALVCPMVIVEQFTISKTGEIIEKERACHDLSFCTEPSNTSVNSRVDKSVLQNCMFGHCMLRMIHYIVTLRIKHPSQPTMIQKVDWKSAYRRAYLR